MHVDPVANMQLLVSGLAIGSIYALVALGFVLIYNAVGVVNFAQGEFVMFPSYIAVTFLLPATAVFGTIVHWQLPVLIVYALVLVLMVGFGLLFNRIAYHPLRDRGWLPVVISTIGVSIFLRNAAQITWGSQPIVMPSLFTVDTIAAGPLHIRPQDLLIIGVTALLIAFQYFLFERTTLGKQMRATAQDRTTARLIGIRVGRIVSITFVYSALLGTISGLLVAPLFTVTKEMGGLIALKAFAASIVGGFGSIPGAIVGGLAIGVIETFGGFYVSSSYVDAIAFIILIGVLLFKPSGLFGERVTEKA
ncbi:MAG: branched-chain amino acid transport system permease protein [Candidatus Eremiobacteraeota bacterium]|jgi:branched-chain amino acid transport system permease protein|nr:branched-chain amino acid transport system permease protein [Candidatus Eremiobacteraeota bacterium]